MPRRVSEPNYCVLYSNGRSRRQILSGTEHPRVPGMETIFTNFLVILARTPLTKVVLLKLFASASAGFRNWRNNLWKSILKFKLARSSKSRMFQMTILFFRPRIQSKNITPISEPRTYLDLLICLRGDYLFSISIKHQIV